MTMWALDAENIATKRGKVKRVVRERYLRDDIPCGIMDCPLCHHHLSETVDAPPLQHHQQLSPRATQYLVLTIDVVLSQMDVLEHAACIELQNIIILETVLERVKAKDLSIYRRLRALLKSDRHFVMFANEHRHDTYVKKEEGSDVENTNTLRDVRALCQGFKWYQTHLADLDKLQLVDTPTQGQPHATTSIAKLLYIANDDVEVGQAVAHGVPAITLAAFVEPLVPQYPEIVDLLAVVHADSSNAADLDHMKEHNGNRSTNDNRMDATAAATFYEEHKSMSDVLAGIKNKRFFQGTLRCNRDHW